MIIIIVVVVVVVVVVVDLIAFFWSDAVCFVLCRKEEGVETRVVMD